MSFDKTKPAATTTLRNSNPEILANNAAIEAALDQDHDYTTGSTQTGKHNKVTLKEESSDQTTAANEMAIYCKDDSGAPSLYLRPQSSGTAIKVATNDGKLSVAASDLATATVSMSNKTLTSPVINTGVSGTAVLDEDDMASDSATKLATQQSVKAYVDDSIDALDDFDPSSYAGEESVTMPNGFTIKFGTANSTSDDAQTFTFDSAFTNTCISVVTNRRSANAEMVLPVTSVSINGFTINRHKDISDTEAFYWIALGY